MKKFMLCVLFTGIITIGFAASVDTVSVYSAAMKKNIRCVVIKPGLYKTAKQKFPVVYLLHGYSGNYANWITRVPALKEQADKYHILIVCPDGAYSSWYFDSPLDASMQYETFISSEVPAWIDGHYNTIRDRHARAITGLSMGGHGALFLGFRHAETFGACGSMSGGVDLDYMKTRFEVTKIIGDTSNNNWHDWSVLNIVEHYPADSVAVIFDCGTEDFFYPANRQLHSKMLALHIPHDYIARPGKHNWDYWRNAVQYQLLFFRNYFEQNKVK